VGVGIQSPVTELSDDFTHSLKYSKSISGQLTIALVPGSAASLTFMAMLSGIGHLITKNTGYELNKANGLI